MTEQELLRRIATLEQENIALKEKLVRFMPTESSINAVETIEEQQIRIPTTIFSKYNSSEEKIELYLSLFRGRTDVYAKRVFSKKHNSAYYTPTCANEWNQMYCHKPKVKCKDCQHRKLLPLTTDVRIYDYVDEHVPKLDRMYRKRLAAYKQMGYKIVTQTSESYTLFSI